MGKKRDYLVWSILSTLFCCLPLGIVAIVYSVKANSAYDAGNTEEYVKSADKAKFWLILSAVLGFIISALAALLQGAAIFALSLEEGGPVVY
ncbi:MAG: CD225/dispanin family protein [Opitutales bacterium]|nr:CD225/dispanin family protein [Opitutales bacterium]